MVCIAALLLCACHNDDEPDPSGGDPVPEEEPVYVQLHDIADTYAGIASYAYRHLWGPYNAHDPSVIEANGTWYSYSTDASYGNAAAPGIQVKRSADLVAWAHVGTAFKGLPPQGETFIRAHGGTPFNGLWAPYIMKAGDEFRLYYSLSSPAPRLSVIGLAVSGSPEGPWTERGLVVTSLADQSRQTNAIDPTVVVDTQGNHWMYYGSAWDGIYCLKLNAATGLAAQAGDKGKRVAQRGFTGATINGNIEGAEVVYNPGFNKYYLFIAYDWLETKYNVRVGRADAPEGPFYDFHGRNLNDEADNTPMILAPYKFQGHGGWQGVSHPAVFQSGGQYYLAHQGRPGVNKYFMVLHVRKLFWTDDGWPVVSPERFAGTAQLPVTVGELAGTWEQIVLGYEVVPGYAEEQVSPGFQESVTLVLHADGTINGDDNNQWTYEAPLLTLDWNGVWTDKLIVSRERDWENDVASTLVFTGLNNAGTAIWGKKID